MHSIYLISLKIALILQKNLDFNENATMSWKLLDFKCKYFTTIIGQNILNIMLIKYIFFQLNPFIFSEIHI